MREYFSLAQAKREQLIAKIAETLSKKSDIVFALVYGSFLDSPSFRDIDIGVYMDAVKKAQIFDLEVNLAKAVSETIKMPFDIIEIKVLNFAPNSFLNNVFSRGKLLFSKNDALLSDLIEITSLEAIENEYIADQSLKELIPT